LKAAFIGTPLFSKDEIHERLTKVKALAVFGSDAISSCAYATEASLVVLMVAGNGALHISLFTALAVAVLMSMSHFHTVRQCTLIRTAAGLTTSAAKTWAKWRDW